MPPSHVLVALDGSPLATEALAHALETFECRLTVLNVVTPVGSATSEGPVLEADADRIDDAEARAETLLAEARERVHETDHSIETVVETGTPGETILDYVDEHDVDHVVMGGHSGPGGELRRRVLGTVSTTVLGGSSVPVTVMR